ncbi:hypothetical protein [Cognatishimia sp. WU-CL00825]|uniref:hypothetical protein n=1 Tax=Cognatishimia sp. WU-CL00825 TaxID=3127658 RepID=UPI003365384A
MGYALAGHLFSKVGASSVWLMNAEILLIIGGTLALLLAITSFVLTQRNAWRAIFLLVTLFGSMNVGVFIWSEILEGWSSFRLFLFWIAALLPPLIGLGIGALLGYLVNWRISKIDATHNKPRR